MKFTEDVLVIAIKIPTNSIDIKVNLIYPIPNNNNYRIDENSELVTTIENKINSYEKDKTLKELKLSKSCIFKNTCNLIYDNNTKIEYIDDETIIVQKARELEIHHNCIENVTEII